MKNFIKIVFAFVLMFISSAWAASPCTPNLVSGTYLGGIQSGNVGVSVIKYVLADTGVVYAFGLNTVKGSPVEEVNYGSTNFTVHQAGGPANAAATCVVEFELPGIVSNSVMNYALLVSALTSPQQNVYGVTTTSVNGVAKQSGRINLVRE